ncbi:MAG: hypothetical protein HY804_13550 [Nitrospinae bacterium]|nr:hypothetical protein [Nitrospinota bacterium]
MSSERRNRFFPRVRFSLRGVSRRARAGSAKLAVITMLATATTVAGMGAVAYYSPLGKMYLPINGAGQEIKRDRALFPLEQRYLNDPAAWRRLGFDTRREYECALTYNFAGDGYTLDNFPAPPPEHADPFCNEVWVRVVQTPLLAKSRNDPRFARYFHEGPSGSTASHSGEPWQARARAALLSLVKG